MSPKKHHAKQPGAKVRRFQRDLSAKQHTYEFDVGEGDGDRRLDAFLAEKLNWRSRAQIRRSIARGEVGVDAAKDERDRLLPKPRPALRLRVGQRVRAVLQAEPPRGPREPPDSSHHNGGGPPTGAPSLLVLFDDEHLLAVCKPPDTSLYPTRRHGRRSLVELVHADVRLRREGSAPPSPCHRLDRDTTGVVVLARTVEARAAVGKQFEERTVEKTYLAVVRGCPSRRSGRIESPLGPDDTSPVQLKQGVRCDGAGKPALTHWRVLAGDARRALLELRPETGRQHQLRVHLASIGHPILGDVLYLGGDEMFLRSLEEPLSDADFSRLGARTLLLHAWKLGFEHPASGERIEIEAPSPFDDFATGEVAGSA